MYRELRCATVQRRRCNTFRDVAFVVIINGKRLPTSSTAEYVARVFVLVVWRKGACLMYGVVGLR